MRRVALLIVFSAFLFFGTRAVAQEPSEVASPSAEATEAAEYKLPHPGMLPDNPLYKLKTLRDKIMLLFIRDPYSRAEYYQNAADKTLFAALKLAEKDNMALSIHTAFKGEHNMTELVSEVQTGFYSSKKLNSDIVKNAHNAYKQHINVLDGIMERANDEEKKSVRQIIEFARQNNASLLKLEAESQISDDFEIEDLEESPIEE